MLTHLDNEGNARMVDVSKKPVTHRRAVSSGRITMSRAAFEAVMNGDAPKGDVLAAARIAGIMALKRTSDIIPLCHPLSVTGCSVDFIPEPDRYSIKAVCSAEIDGKTGVEMETLMGVSAALLTIYDMCKAMDRSMTVTDIMLDRKEGGKSGEYRRKEI